MAFLVGGANSASGAYEISNSCRFNRGDSPALSYSFSSTDSSWTVSCWIKRAELSTNTMYPFGFGTAGTDATGVSFSGSDSMAYYDEDGSTLVRDTTILFRDPSAWYHVVCKNDGGTITTYMNGVQQATGSGGEALDGSTFYVGRFAGSTAYHWDGYISEFYFIDGTAYSPSTFAETNDNGVWVPIEASPTFGSDGFFCEFKETGTSANSSGIGADTSGNDNHLTVSNLAATDITIDTPTNNFCTLNTLHKSTSDVAVSEGNLKMVSGYASGWQHCAATMAVKNGKWYWEAKALAVAATDKTSIGVFQFDTTDVDFVNNTNTDRSSKGLSGHGAGTGSYSYAQGEIVMCGMDLDNNKVYWGKNGTWFGDLDPAAGSGSTTQTISNANFCVPVVGGYADSSWELNFGVPQFSISSSQADDAGYGNFEYDVPAGFYSLCTKNLGEYG